MSSSCPPPGPDAHGRLEQWVCLLQPLQTDAFLLPLAHQDALMMGRGPSSGRPGSASLLRRARARARALLPRPRREGYAPLPS